MHRRFGGSPGNGTCRPVDPTGLHPGCAGPCRFSKNQTRRPFRESPRCRSCSCVEQPYRASHESCGQRRGEVDELFFFELEQQRTAGHPFELFVRLPPVPVLTQHPGNGGSTALPMPGDGIADKREVFLSDLTAANLIQDLCQGAVPSWQSTLAKFSRGRQGNMHPCDQIRILYCTVDVPEELADMELESCRLHSCGMRSSLCTGYPFASADFTKVS